MSTRPTGVPTIAALRNHQVLGACSRSRPAQQKDEADEQPKRADVVDGNRLRRTIDDEDVGGRGHNNTRCRRITRRRGSVHRLHLTARITQIPQAVPVLRQEALQAQSANIDTVSGATVTSQGYITSLQAALDAAHLGG